MKGIYYTFILALMPFAVYPQSDDDNFSANYYDESYSWNTEVIISDPARDANLTGGKQSISVTGNLVYIVWEGVVSPGNSNVNFRSSTDGGLTWGAIQVLTSAAGETKKPVVASNDTDVFVAWKDTRDNPEGEIYFKVSRDEGNTWSSDIRVTSSASQSNLPSIDSDSDNVYLVWEEIISSPLSAQCYLTASSNRGIDWSGNQLITDSDLSVEEGAPVVSADQGGVNVVYGSDRHSAVTGGYNWEHYYRRSTNGAITFENPVRLTNDTDGDSRFPMVAASNGKIHIVWWDDRDDRSYTHSGYPPTPLPTDRNYEIYYIRSLDNSLHWESLVRLTDNDMLSCNPAVAASGDNVAVVWQDYRNSDSEIYLKFSPDAGTSWSDDFRITNSAGEAEWPGIDIDDSGNIYLMWGDNKTGSSNIYFAKGTKEVTEAVSDNSFDTAFALKQNYPNPFNPLTTIEYEIGKPGFVRLTVYDILGNNVETLVGDNKNAGRNRVQFDGSKLASGIYFYRLSTGNYIETKKLLLIK